MLTEHVERAQYEVDSLLMYLDNYVLLVLSNG